MLEQTKYERERRKSVQTKIACNYPLILWETKMRFNYAGGVKMNRMAHRLMNFGRPKRSMSRGITMFALGAAIGAGVSMWKNGKFDRQIEAIEENTSLDI